MSENHATSEDIDDESGDAQKGRQRSTIAFPYTDYEGAAELAAAIHGNVGHGTCSLPQLAAWMNSSVKSSSFRTLISAARLFGLIESDNAETYRLTDLGTRIADPTQAKSAQAEAFLRVPLFAALFDKYKIGIIPPSAALEREIAGLGVSEKQKARARQVFESSAQQTGFRSHGGNRLVMPAVVVPPAGAGANSNGNGKGGEAGNGHGGASGGGGGGGGSSGQYHPFIQGLLQKLPPPDTEWPVEARQKWLVTAANIFGLMYTQPNGQDVGFIDVEVKKL